MFQKILQWFTKLGSKKSVEPEWKESPMSVPDLPDEPEIPAKVKAEEKRKKRRARNIKYNNRTKGAFGKPKVMRRDRGD